MELTILLSKVFGAYLVIGGLAYVLRQKFFMAVVHHFVEERMLRVVLAIAELVVGLFIIFGHNVWETLPQTIVSLIGWLMLLEGIFYLFMPDKVVRKVVKTFNTTAWYVGGGVVSIIAGLYLLNSAFGFF